MIDEPIQRSLKKHVADLVAALQSLASAVELSRTVGRPVADPVERAVGNARRVLSSFDAFCDQAADGETWPADHLDAKGGRR